MYHVRRMLQANHGGCGPLQSTAQSGVTALPASDEARQNSLSAPADQGTVQPSPDKRSYSTTTPGPLPGASAALVNAHLAISAFHAVPATIQFPSLAWAVRSLPSDSRNGLQAKRRQ